MLYRKFCTTQFKLFAITYVLFKFKLLTITFSNLILRPPIQIRSYIAQLQSLYLVCILIHQTGFYPKVANKVQLN